VVAPGENEQQQLVDGVVGGGAGAGKLLERRWRAHWVDDICSRGTGPSVLA
jgi:hypothetical protein